MKMWKNEWLQLMILAAPFCAVVLLWDKLPPWVPIHWNARGEIDGYARKAFGTLLLPTGNVVLAVLCAALPKIDPKLGKHDTQVRASVWRTVRILRLGISGFLSLVSLAMLAAAAGWFRDGAQFSYFIYGGLAVLYMLLGNFMSKLRPNYFVGIRTPWTLESKEVWRKTHRLGGRLMMLGGLLILLSCRLVPLEKIVWCVLLPVSIGTAALSFLYSFVIYRKEQVGRQTVS